MSKRNVTVLWALRSPCNLGCRYCYFGTVEEDRASGTPVQPGTLSHLSRHDLSLADVAEFVETLSDPDCPVGRIFLAGGEPLIWPPALDIVQAIKATGVEVVLCTNGIPLNRPEVSNRIVELGVDAVSISLDSTDSAANDLYRSSRSRLHGWSDVVTGIRSMLAARAEDQKPGVGIYTVITRRNIDQVLPVGRLAADLGCGYYVPQPISLASDHALNAELSLTSGDVTALGAELDRLYTAHLPLRLPARSYIARFLTSIGTKHPGLVADCFGGQTLFFVEPDGSVWDCPSGLKIAATPPEQRRNIRGTRATDVFRASGCGDCELFSRDCVNMWPLMDFGAFALNQEAVR